MMRVGSNEVTRLLTEIGASETERYNIDVGRRVSNYRYLLSTARTTPKGKRILDVGCGSGLLLAACALWGAGQCVGLEVDDEGIAKADDQVRRLSDIGYRLPVSVQRHNVLEGLPFPDASFDLIVMEEVISHLAQLDLVLQESVRVLAPDGYLIISDNNNPFNAVQEKERVRLWRAFEKGPRPNAERFASHERSYEAMRARLIVDWCPELDTDEVDRLARHTSGLWGERLKSECRKYVRSRQMPEYVYEDGCPSVNPAGFYMERPVDPYVMRVDLLEFGCASVHVYPHWASSSGVKRLADRVLRTCLPVSVARRVARGFIVVGRS